MKKMILLLCWFNVFTHIDAQETIQLTSGEWPPYLSENLNGYGVVARIVTEAFAEVGITVDYGFFLWERAYNQAKAGRWDGSAIWLRNAEREKHFYYSDTVIENDVYFFHLKDYAFEWDRIEDLKGISIGGTDAYFYGGAFEAAENAGIIEVQRAARDQLNFRKLLRGRIQIFPINDVVGYYQIQQNFSSEQAKRFTYHPKPLYRRSLHLILSKKIEKNKRLITLFNQGLGRLKTNGKLELYKKELLKGEIGQ